jgi:hypothetical protein
MRGEIPSFFLTGAVDRHPSEGLDFNCPGEGDHAKMAKEEDKVKWYLRPVSIVLSLFFVLGPFGLPLLYKSPKFSRRSKIILTLAVAVYTFYLIFATLEIARVLYKRMEELKEVLG